VDEPHAPSLQFDSTNGLWRVLVLPFPDLVPDSGIGGVNLFEAGPYFQDRTLLVPKHAFVFHAVGLGKGATFHDIYLS
jgi:hypothetical protein